MLKFLKKFLKKEIQKINIPVRAILDNSKSVQPTPSTEGDSLF